MAIWSSTRPPEPPNGHREPHITTWTSKRLPGVPTGHLELQTATWSSKRPPGASNSHLELQTATCSSKWYPGAPNGTLNSRLSPGDFNLQIYERKVHIGKIQPSDVSRNVTICKFQPPNLLPKVNICKFQPSNVAGKIDICIDLCCYLQHLRLQLRKRCGNERGRYHRCLLFTNKKLPTTRRARTLGRTDARINPL